MRALWLILLAGAGCGGKSGGATTIDNSTATAVGGDLVRVPEGADATRECPPGLLEQLAGGWPDWMAEQGDLHPRLDACLRGNLIGPSIVVYASAPHGEGSQSEEGYPARRLIVGEDGQLLAEGPAGGGDWMIAAPSLAGLVDLDGDGVHEIVEHGSEDVMVGKLLVWRLSGREWTEAGSIVSSVDDNDYRCSVTWSASSPDAQGRRTLDIVAEAQGEPMHSDHGAGPAAACPDPGTHRFSLTDGTLVDDVPAASEEPEDNREGDSNGEGGVYVE